MPRSCGDHRRSQGLIKRIHTLNTPPIGFGTTNNPIEQYNAVMKKFFTERLKLSIVKMLKVFVKVIQYESAKVLKYSYSDIKMVDNKLLKKAKTLDLNNFK